MQNSPHKQENTLAQAVTSFLAGQPPKKREEAQQELNRFVRWFGQERSIRELSSHEIEIYAESVAASDTDPAKKLAPVKAFLTYAKKEGLSATNLSIHVRVKTVSQRSKKAAKPSPEKTFVLTSQGYAELQSELDRLKSERPFIAEEIKKAAADKDFAENAPLDAAKEHQGHIEARIKELEDILNHATFLQQDKGTDSTKVELGNIVTLRDLASGETVQYRIVNPTEASPIKGKVSVASPTGKALLNRSLGEEIKVSAPGGAIHYRIEGIEDRKS